MYINLTNSLHEYAWQSKKLIFYETILDEGGGRIIKPSYTHTELMTGFKRSLNVLIDEKNFIEICFAFSSA